MREELDTKLCGKYPELFKNRYTPPKESLMCWGFDCGDGWYNLIDNLCILIDNHIMNERQLVRYNKEYHQMREAALEGDWSLFNKSQEKLIAASTEDHSDWLQRQREQLLGPVSEFLEQVECKIEPVTVIQVKEKFGGLRFYYDGGDEYIQGAVSMAERMSYSICEECGNLGKSRSGGWVRTLCDQHAAKYDYMDNEDIDNAC
jgi:hypothetical protein